MVLGIVLPLAVVVPHAAAQECPSRAWPTTRFELRHQRAPGDILDAVLSRPAAARRMIELLVNPVADPAHDPVFGDAVPLVDAAWARLVEGQLHDIAQRLQAAGFRCPKIRTSGDDGELRYVAYLIDFDADPEQSVMDPARGRAYTEIHVPDSPYFLLDRANFNLATGAIEQDLYWTLAHEFFHMVQGTYDLAYGSVGMAHSGAGRDFVVEGGASGVATYLVSQRFPGYLEERESTRRRLGGYSYHFSPLDADKDSRLKNAYDTSSFWFHLAERFGLPAIEDLHRRRLAGHTLEQQVRWLDDGLRGGPHANGGFGPVLAHFHTELASYGPGRRYSKVPEADWMQWIFANCGPSHRWTAPPAAVSYVIPGSALAGSQFLPLEAFDGGCVKVEWAGFPDSVAFQVEAAGPDAESLRQLQLGVAQTSFRPYRNCWSSRSPGTCLVEGASAPLERDGMWYRTWELVPGEYGAAGDALLVFTNVDERAPWETRPIYYDLRITFRMLHEFASMAGGGGGGPSASDIDSPLAIELDDFRSDFVRPYPHPSLAHIPDPCVARFLFLNSETGEGVELNLDHSGPIGPGIYDISRGNTPSSFAPPEDHPGTFTGAFGIVMGGPDVRLRRFFLHSGSVTINSIAGRLVQGEVRANGWRNPYMDGSTLGDDVSMEPTQATIQARFTLIASRHYPNQEESATGRLALQCLEGPRPSDDPSEEDEPEEDTEEETEETEEEAEEETEEEAEEETEGRPISPPAVAEGEIPTDSDAVPGPDAAESPAENQATRTANVSLEFISREQGGGDLRSMLARSERRTEGSATTIVADRIDVGLSLPEETLASCVIPPGTPSGIERLVLGAAFRAEPLRLRLSSTEMTLEMNPSQEQGDLVITAEGEAAIRSAPERRDARSARTRYDVPEAFLEARWRGGTIRCADPLAISFQVIEVF